MYFLFVFILSIQFLCADRLQNISRVTVSRRRYRPRVWLWKRRMSSLLVVACMAVRRRCIYGAGDIPSVLLKNGSRPVRFGVNAGGVQRLPPPGETHYLWQRCKSGMK